MYRVKTHINFPLKNLDARQRLAHELCAFHKIHKIKNHEAPRSHLCSENLTMGYSGEEPQKVIIFDWDDTICPSSFFDRQQIENMDDLPASVSCCVVGCGLGFLRES